MKALVLGILIVPQLLFGQRLEYKKSLVLMGSAFEINAISHDLDLAKRSVEAAVKEIKRIERLISSWDPGSQTSEINRQAGIKSVRVDEELFELIRRSLKVSQLTGGAFDISFAAVDKIWTFDGSESDIPPKEKITQSVNHINYEKIVLDAENSTVFLMDKGMKIGFGGIGKGYAANRAAQLLQQMGITDGVVNASGDLINWGRPYEDDHWRVGISDPGQPGEVMAWLEVNDTAVVTSGDYEKYFTHAGKRYAHIIDPRTGYPTTGIKSVTIVCPDTELADALATSVFVLGAEDGLALIDALQGIEGLLVTDSNEIRTSKNLQLNYY